MKGFWNCVKRVNKRTSCAVRLTGLAGSWSISSFTWTNIQRKNRRAKIVAFLTSLVNQSKSLPSSQLPVASLLNPTTREEVSSNHVSYEDLPNVREILLNAQISWSNAKRDMTQRCISAPVSKPSYYPYLPWNTGVNHDLCLVTVQGDRGVPIDWTGRSRHITSNQGHWGALSGRVHCHSRSWDHVVWGSYIRRLL